MVALFSTLLSKSNPEATVSTSSSSIPTVIQLYTSSPLSLDTTKVAGHAILSYQAVEVDAPSSDDSTLFGRTRKKKSATVVESPNLGVWNCRITKESALVDSLLTIPAEGPYYCMTVDLSDPSQVEPAMTRMQEALVRYLIAYPPSTTEGSTSLYDLRLHQFGLAPDDEPAATTAAPDETDRKVHVNLMICAIRPPHNDDYQKTQAQNLVLYHLRRYAAAVNATLCFVGTATNEDAKGNDDNDNKAEEEQTTLSLLQLAHVWREFARGNELEEPEGVYGPGKNQELIESVLLRNANCPGQWEASKDSLWKALPRPSSSDDAKHTTSPRSTGDDGWLLQLRDSLGTAAEPVAATTAPSAPKTEDAEVSSFFENLLKK